MLTPAILAPGFDGIVASGGAYVEVGSAVIRDVEFPQPLRERVIDVLESYDAAYSLEATDRVMVRGRDRDLRRVIPVEPEVVADPRAVAFNKALVFRSEVSMRTLASAIGRRVAVVPHSTFDAGGRGGEIYLQGLHKASGADAAARALGAGRSQAIAVGDGANDAELLEWAALGVAINGSPRELLAVADMVARPPEELGLAHLFEDLGLT